MAERISWIEAQRAKFIDGRLADGGLRRADIEAEFEVSTTTASAVIKRFLREHPGRMVYDSSAKKFVASIALPSAEDLA